MWFEEAMASYADGEFDQRASAAVRPADSARCGKTTCCWLDSAGKKQERETILRAHGSPPAHVEPGARSRAIRARGASRDLPPGARYGCHLDRFQDDDHRVISVSLYLNLDWSAEDGGALRLHLEKPESGPYEDVLPAGGTLVCFLSGRFQHEVLPSRRDRLSVTGWLTRRSSQPIP